MEAVKAILSAEGTSVEEMDVNENLEYESELYHDLVIEKIGEDRLSVGQYYKQRMDLMHAPEVVFDVSDYSDWTPVEYTNHDTVPQVYDANEDGVEGLDGLLATWDKNLKSQFPADRVAGEEE